MVGTQAIDQGNCSRFQINTPHSCMKNPYIIDLLHEAPYNQQVISCCKGGILASWGQDPSAAVSTIQVIACWECWKYGFYCENAK